MLNYKEEMEKIKGVAVVQITPFTQKLKVDYDGLRGNTQYLLDKGLVSGNGILIPNGSTGECFSLSVEERKKIAETVIDVAKGKVPIYIGCNNSNVDTVIDLAKHAENIKADGIMVIPPYYWTPCSNDQIVAFYKSIASRTSLPIMVYNNPTVTQVDMGIELLSRLVEIDNVISIKETSPYIVKFEQVCRELGNKVKILAGSSEVQPYTSLMGDVGFVTGLGNALPEILISMYKRGRDGELKEAKNLRDKIAPFVRFAGSVRGGGQIIAVYKGAVDLVGGDGGFMKPPIIPLLPKEREELKRVLKIAGANIAGEIKY
jgi:4-hydroxy-tetrahydrodipicolinate synthase